MTRRYRLEYLKRKKAKEREKLEKELGKQTSVEKSEAKNSFFKELLGWVLYIGIIIGLTYFIVTYVGQRTMVSGD